MRRKWFFRGLRAVPSTFGAVAGAAIGLLGGPEGAIGGAVAGSAITEVLNDVGSRWLSTQESRRVEQAATIAATRLRGLLDAGSVLRDDGFFGSEIMGRSNAHELIEGVLLRCRETYEESKLPYVAGFAAHVAVDRSVTAATANQILGLAARLTYRQLCCLAVIADQERVSRLSGEDFMVNATPLERAAISRDILDLAQNGLVVTLDGTVVMEYFNPNNLTLTIFGHKLYGLMGLNDIPQGHLDEVVEHLNA